MNAGEPIIVPVKVGALPLLNAAIAQWKGYKFHQYFPECLPECKKGSPNHADHAIRPGYKTPICRELYVKSLQFFRAGLDYPERLFMAANRIGKTETAAYEVTCHLTGLYPDWWKGRKYAEPGEWWAAGDTTVTTRDIMQVALMGDLDQPKTGMIPAHTIINYTPRPGVPKGIEMVWVRHRTGGIASLQFKSYDQGRRVFQGTKKQGVWLDEEPKDTEVYTECLLRTMNTDGIVIATFTPLSGLTEFIDEWLKTSDLMMPTGELVPADVHVFGEGAVHGD